MQYVSTRNGKSSVQSAEAIARGIAPDGGLYVPAAIPRLRPEQLKELAGLDYSGRAKEILKLYLTDFTEAELDQIVRAAYVDRFDGNQPAPLYRLGNNNAYMLELWHGPTCAFKDMALQVLPHLMVKAAAKIGDTRTIVVLVATSGDTGKAALEGFCDVNGTKILVFYPEKGVSEMQKRQMVTQSGDNVCVAAVRGNFDDAQTAVKNIFTDPELAKLLNEKGMVFSSANSINWGRLVPQIVYYVSAYLDLLQSGVDLTNGFNIVVPTGNFGNILAAYYAKEMGLPVHKLICASNRNNVLTDFIDSGTYDRRRDFFATSSPSMDILISSNLERLLYHISAGDDALVCDLMAGLKDEGHYTLPAVLQKVLGQSFFGGFCDETATMATIRATFDRYHYLADTHTAVGLNVYEQYLGAGADNRPTVLASTANAYKFPGSVLAAFGRQEADEFAALRALESLTEQAVPVGLSGLDCRELRFFDICDRDELDKAVLSFLNI